MFNATFLWLIAGVILCLMELLFPTAFVEFMMGIAAFIVALISLILPHSGLQIALWMIFSTLLVLLSRRIFTPKRKSATIEGKTEGETLTEIPAGETGRILYEGNSWRGKCSEESLAIAPKQKVYIVGREGNTLIVLPKSLLEGE
ncbi:MULTISPECIES: NfeD family protein [Spirulina sp. CCY15215]|uniref:NfeD family protein n=1 Tax=Spirulina sp. CCY15215 TaxID=2767591 RepID=UPI0019515B42|nr:NfeD family protein [Spirulina major]